MIHYKDWTVIQLKHLALAPSLVEEPPIERGQFRFYFKGQELTRHHDRPACEISVSMNISTNATTPWPIYFELPNGEVKELYTDHGDAVLYKGMEVDHWRNPLKGTPKVYYHQIFMHFVRADGYHVEYAYDTKC